MNCPARRFYPWTALPGATSCPSPFVRRFPPLSVLVLFRVRAREVGLPPSPAPAAAADASVYIPAGAPRQSHDRDAGDLQPFPQPDGSQGQKSYPWIRRCSARPFLTSQEAVDESDPDHHKTAPECSHPVVGKPDRTRPARAEALESGRS